MRRRRQLGPDGLARAPRTKIKQAANLRCALAKRLATAIRCHFVFEARRRRAAPNALEREASITTRVLRRRDGRFGADGV